MRIRRCTPPRPARRLRQRGIENPGVGGTIPPRAHQEHASISATPSSLAFLFRLREVLVCGPVSAPLQPSASAWSTKCSRSCPQYISPPTRKVGAPKTPSSTASAVSRFSFSFTSAVKEKLKRDTAEAVELGVFGAPTFLVGGEMYWGQDRLHFVDQALADG